MKVYTLAHNDDRTFWMEPVLVPDQMERRKYWIKELNDSTEFRRNILDLWIPVVLKPMCYRGTPKFNRLKDIHSGIMYKGCEYIISDKARQIFEREFEGEALYLPVDIPGTDAVYWALWVTTVLDAIDICRSNVSKVAPTYLHISEREYKDEIVDGVGMFRLPMIYSEPDQVTDKFRKVVEKSGLTNFRFWDKSNSAAKRKGSR